MVRPEIVLFGDSITGQSFRSGGWGASLTDTYARKADIVLRGYGGYTTRLALFLLHQVFPLDSPKAPAAVTVFFGANDAALLGRASERQHVPLEEYTENLKKIVRHLKRCSPTMLIVLITPPPIDEDGLDAFARFPCCLLFEYQTFKFLDLLLADHMLGCSVVLKITKGIRFLSMTLHHPCWSQILFAPLSSRSLYGDKARELPERTNEAAGTYVKACLQVADELGARPINLWSKMQETEGWQKKFLSDGLHLTPEGNSVVYREVIRVFDEASLSAQAMPNDFPHHSEIDWENPEKSFQHPKCA